MGPSLNLDVSASNFTMNNLYHHSERGIDILHNAVALAALHDSGRKFPAAKMPSGNAYGNDAEAPQMVDGDRSVDHYPLASWSCRCGQICHHADFLLGTAGCRVAWWFLFLQTRPRYTCIPWLKAAICRNVEGDPTILARSLQVQLQKLISEPAQLRPIDENQKPVIIVVDGLDECEGQHVQEEILCTIRNFTSQYHLPFRFIVASRPEAHISEVFESPFYCGRYRSVDVEESFKDVKKYLCDEFSRIHGEHRTMVNIPLPWPSPEILKELVRKSSGYFIYASTVIRFIDDKNYRPTEQLAVILDRTSSSSTFDTLDQLYIRILSSAPRQDQLLPVLCAISNFDFCPGTLDQLLGLNNGDARLLLRGLHSVLEIPEKDNSSLPISPHHASFFDFLNNPRRSGTFYVGSSHYQMGLAQSLLSLLAGEFRMDIVNCGSTWEQSPLSFIPFITSLPPRTELLSPIKQLNPDYVFKRYLDLEDFDKFLQWLKKIPGAPADLVELWEDYEYMSFVVKKFPVAKFYTTSNKSSVLPPLDIVFQIPGMPRLLQILILVDTDFPEWHVREIRPLTGLTWDDLKTTICALRPIVGRDVDKIRELAHHILHGSFFGEIYPWPTLCRDLARQLICRARATSSLESLTQ
ncbi:putative nwd2 protein [Mycena sanguinolenta]|uniref:Putative nwd2 protein n=1 Tax=Mycena sanguinolenta TaxID=230812 RepID=A0A8H6ZFX1_9AGAR|nr:putative nwd2 protein [Mycena sanguinolenta]